jgi:hypothetical protein
MSKIRFVISLTGGLVEVFTNVPGAEVILVDWDCDSFDPEMTPPVEFDDHGEHYKVFVEPYSFEKLPSGPLSYVGRALELKGYRSIPEQPQLSDRELATVLSALRYWQNGLLEDGEEFTFGTAHFEQHTPLNPNEIDALCERLNEEP